MKLMYCLTRLCRNKNHRSYRRTHTIPLVRNNNLFPHHILLDRCRLLRETFEYKQREQSVSCRYCLCNADRYVFRPSARYPSTATPPVRKPLPHIALFQSLLKCELGNVQPL